MDKINTIKETLTAKEVAEYYGLIIKHNVSHCFMHSDKTPSMSFKYGKFKCFSCGIGGSCIDLCMNLFSISFIDACKKLNNDFRLGLNFEKQSFKEQRENARQQRQRYLDKKLVESYEKWEQETFIKMCDYLRLLEQFMSDYAPKNMAECLHELFVLSIMTYDYLEYLTNILIFGSFKEKSAAKKEIDKVVKTIEQAIRKSRNIA